MKKVLGWTIALMLLCVGLVAIVAATFPAETAYRYLEPHLRPLRLQGLSGSVWRGSAVQASVDAVPLGSLAWTLRPDLALTLRARGDATLTGPRVTATGRFVVDSDGIAVETLTADLPASLLGPALDIPALVLLGELDLDLNAVTIRDGWIAAAEGKLVWRDAGVGGAAEARFSDLSVTFTTPRPGVVEGMIRDGGGALLAEGWVRIQGERFQAEVALHVRGENPQLAEALMFVGERTADGGSLLRVQGTMRRLF